MATAVGAIPSAGEIPQNGGLNGTSQKAAEDCGCDGPEAPVVVTDNAPTVSDLETIGELPVQDASGKEYKFSEIYGDPSAERHFVVFIRHFFCGVSSCASCNCILPANGLQNCREYIRALCSSIPPSSLSSNTKLTIIGCGSHELISRYIKETNCVYPLYTDQSQELYKALNLVRSLELGKKPEYIKTSFSTLIVSGIMDGLKTGRHALKGGDFAQVGGEFLFVKKEGKWEVQWCHRMKTTRDHTEMRELKKLLG